MARLYRPHIPLAVRCKVAERQVSQDPRLDWGFYLSVDWQGKYGKRLEMLLRMLAKRFGCEVNELRLDHEPALALRRRRFTGGGRFPTEYIPDANDPEHLAYRPHGAEFTGSHDVKTRIRGDHGQYSDIQLIKRERRRQKKAEGRPKKKWASGSKLSTRGRSRFPKAKSSWPKRTFPKRRK